MVESDDFYQRRAELAEAQARQLLAKDAEIHRLNTIIEAADREMLKLRGALMKICAIRDSIIGCQCFNWSEHAYPLIAVLDEAGFPGAGYEIARANLGTLIERANKAESKADRMRRVFEAAKAWQWRECSGEHRVCLETVAEHDAECPVSKREEELFEALVAAGDVAATKESG